MPRKHAASFLTKLNFGRALGPLEAQIMEAIWDRGPSTVRDVLNVLLDDRQIAYTTVMTVMGNLVEKGLLEQTRSGRTYVYATTVKRSEFVRSQIKSIMDILLDSFTEPALSYFIERLSGGDSAQLAQLEHLITQKRAQQDSEDKEK